MVEAGPFIINTSPDWSSSSIQERQPTGCIWFAKWNAVMIALAGSMLLITSRIYNRQSRSVCKRKLMQNTGEYAVGWFTLSLINAGLAQSKGRSGLAWWLGSLLLGPIATLLIVISEPVKAKAVNVP